MRASERRHRDRSRGRSLAAAGLVAVLVTMLTTAEARPITGTLTPRGCIADPVNNPDACGRTAKGLDGALSAAVSPAGTSVYVAGWSDDALVRFSRDTTTGALTPRGCIAATSSNPDGCQVTAKGLVQPYQAAVSPDGTSVYVVGGLGTIVRFTRNRTTGKLTPAGCIGDRGNNPQGCARTAKGMDGANGVVVSPDGRSVYVAAYNDDALVRFDRNRTTGALTPRGCIAERGSNPAGCARTIAGGLLEPYIGSVTVSSDGRFVYAAGSAGPSIAILRRDATTGALTPRGCIADPSNNTEGCPRTAKGLVNPYLLVVSRDGTSAYAADHGTSGVVRFARDTTTGLLTYRGCVADPAHNDAGCAKTAPGLYGTGWVAVANDGRSVYAAGTVGNAIVRFGRDRATGVLTPRGCIADPAHNPASCAGTALGLDQVQSLVLTNDGTSLYAPGPLDNALVRFRRA